MTIGVVIKGIDNLLKLVASTRVTQMLHLLHQNITVPMFLSSWSLGYPTSLNG